MMDNCPLGLLSNVLSLKKEKLTTEKSILLFCQDIILRCILHVFKVFFSILIRDSFIQSRKADILQNVLPKN